MNDKAHLAENRRRFKAGKAKDLFDQVVEQYGRDKPVRQDYDRLLKTYEMGTASSRDFGRNGDGGSSGKGLHLVSGSVDSRLAYMAYRNGTWLSRATSDEQDARTTARMRGAALDEEWRKTKAWRECRRCAKDADIYGTGFARVFYDAAGLFLQSDNYATPEPENKPEETLEDRALMEDLEAMGILIQEDSARDSKVMLGRLSPYNVVTPDGYLDIAKMPWFGVRHLRRLIDVQNDPKLRGTGKLKPNESLASSRIDNMEKSNRPTGEPEHIVIWEIWYVTWGTRVVGNKRQKVREIRVAMMTDAPETSNGSPSSSEPTVLSHQVSYLDSPGYPFEALRFIDVPERFRGASRVDRMLGVANDMQEIWDQSVEGFLSAFAEKVLVNEGAFSKTSRRQMSSTRRETIPVKGQGSPGRHVAKIAPSAMPQEWGMFWMGLKSMYTEVGGGDETMRGSRSSAGSATEVAARTSIMQTKSGDSLQIYEEFLTDLAVKYLSLMGQFYTDRRSVRVRDPQTGVDGFDSYDGQAIAGQADIRLSPNSTRAENDETEKAALMGFITTVTQTIGLLQQLQAPPAIINDFMTRIMDAWDMDSAATRDAFAAITQGAVGAAQAAPTPEAPIESGNASDPVNGETLTGSPGQFGELPNAAAMAARRQEV